MLRNERKFALLLLILASAFSAWGFWPELTAGEFQYSDVTFHLSLLRELDAVVRAGGSAFDFWFDASPFGYPVFRVYQHLPHLVIYACYRLLGSSVALEMLVPLFTVLAVSALPFSFYWAARVLGSAPLAAAVTGAFAVLLAEQEGYGLGLENYAWGTNGIITQLWALVFLAPACAYAFRVVTFGKGWGLCALLSFLAVGSHILAAYVIGTSVFIGLLGAVLSRTSSVRAVFGRALMLSLLFLAVTAHQWVFILSDSNFIHRSVFEPEWKFSGRGIYWTVSEFFKGGLFDRGRFPIVTVFVCIGLSFALCARSQAWAMRLVVSSFILWLSLLCGYQAWGFLFESLPLLSSMHMHRFIIGVQLFGVVLAGQGVMIALSWFPSVWLRGVWVVLVLAMPVLQQAGLFQQQHSRIEAANSSFSKDTDTQALLSYLEERPPGWIYAGMARTWAKDLVVADYVEVYHPIVIRGLPTMGMLFHSMGKAGDSVFSFDPQREQHYRFFGVNTVVAPAHWTAPQFLSEIAQFGRYKVFSYPAGVVLSVENSDFVGTTSAELYADAAHARPIVNLDSKVGTVRDVRWSSQDASGSVDAAEPGIIFFRTSFHPNWEAKVDSVPVSTREVEPGFIGVEVDAGQHQVELHYRPSRSKPFLCCFGVLLCLALVGVEFKRPRLAVQ